MLRNYRVFSCKGCGKRHDHSDLGPANELRGNPFVDPFNFSCAGCGATYTYHEPDTRLVTEDRGPQPRR